MKVLVIGSGGREHALAWRLRNSASVSQVYADPGNPGSAQVAHCTSAPDYVELAARLAVDLTVVGPEVPLVTGLVDQFRARHMPIVGPTAENAALEGSKIHSKHFMQKHGVNPSWYRYSIGSRGDTLAGHGCPGNHAGCVAGLGSANVAADRIIDNARTSFADILNLDFMAASGNVENVNSQVAGTASLAVSYYRYSIAHKARSNQL